MSRISHVIMIIAQSNAPSDINPETWQKFHSLAPVTTQCQPANRWALATCGGTMATSTFRSLVMKHQPDLKSCSSTFLLKLSCFIPRCSRYAIRLYLPRFVYINAPNVGKHTIHGAKKHSFSFRDCRALLSALLCAQAKTIEAAADGAFQIVQGDETWSVKREVGIGCERLGWSMAAKVA